MTRRLQYQKRDPAAVGGNLCAGCKDGDHSNHVAALGSICVGCACGWKPPVRVKDRPDLQSLIPGGDTEPRAPILRARRADDSRDAITHEAVPGSVLACGRCDAAIEGFGWELNSPAPLQAMPCGCAVRDVPVWARAQKKGARRG